jgi:hypothetical protein
MPNKPPVREESSASRLRLGEAIRPREVAGYVANLATESHHSFGPVIYTIVVAHLTECPPIRLAPEKPENRTVVRQPRPTHVPLYTAPSFYITGRQRLSPGAILLAIVAAGFALSAVLYALGHAGHVHFHSGAPGADRSATGIAGPGSAASQKDDDDPNQVDTIVLGGPDEAPVPAQPGDHVSTVHPTILIHLPRTGDAVGYIPNTPAGRLLYNWLAAFNQPNYTGLANALPPFGLGSATEAQMELRQQTGGFTLLSAKEVRPGILVFRLRDQTPSGTEALGTLRVRSNSNPAAIASFSLRGVPSPHKNTTTAVAALSH